MQNLFKQLRTTLAVVSAGVSSHFISKVLDSKNTQIEKEAQALRDQKFDLLTEHIQRVQQNLSELQNSFDKFSAKINNNTTINNIPDSLIQEMANKAKDTQEVGDTLNKLMEKCSISDPSLALFKKGEGIQEILDGFNKIKKNAKDLKEFVDKVDTGISTPEQGFPPLGVDNNFIGNSNFNFENFTTYLDSLSLLQESALLHILLFIIILLTLINIFAALFANEILKYFDLENKYPSISGFLKLRAKFQKYYLTWNILFLLILILAAILLNIFIFIVC